MPVRPAPAAPAADLSAAPWPLALRRRPHRPAWRQPAAAAPAAAAWATWTAWAALGAVLATLLAGCAVSPKGPVVRDGPPASPPPNLAATPDAEPRIEPVRPGGPNKPYVVLGQSYTPQTGDPVVHERGLASWYGSKFHGRRTASGEVYNMYAMTAAHRTLPIPSYARVRNPANGREVIVRINDRGPFHRERIIDLSYTAALKLGVLRGVAPVELERLTFEQIRTGSWRRGGTPAEAAPAYAQAAAEPARAAPPLAVLREGRGSSAWAADGGRALDPAAAAAAAAAAGADAAAAATNPAATLPPAEPAEAAAGAAVGVPAAAAPVRAPRAVPVGVPDNPPERGRAYTDAAEGWWLQLGAFRRLDGAEALRQKVASDHAALAPLLTVFNEASLYRLQAGPYASRSEARLAAARLRETLAIAPLIVERR